MHGISRFFHYPYIYIYIYMFHFQINIDGTPLAARKFKGHVLGKICLDSGPTLRSKT